MDLLKEDKKKALAVFPKDIKLHDFIEFETDHFRADEYKNFIGQLTDEEILTLVQSSRKENICSEELGRSEFTSSQKEILATTIVFIRDTWIVGKGLWYDVANVPDNSLLDEAHRGNVALCYGPVLSVHGSFVDYDNFRLDFKRIYNRDATFNQQGYFELIKERLLPILLVINKISAEEGVHSFVHVAGLGTGAFAYCDHSYSNQKPIKVYFGEALIQLLTQYQEKLLHIAKLEFHDVNNQDMDPAVQKLWESGVQIRQNSQEDGLQSSVDVGAGHASSLVFSYFGVDPNLARRKGFFVEKSELGNHKNAYWTVVAGDSMALYANDNNDNIVYKKGENINGCQTLYHQFEPCGSLSFWRNEAASSGATDLKSIMLRQATGCDLGEHGALNEDVRKVYRDNYKKVAQLYGKKPDFVYQDEKIVSPEQVDGNFLPHQSKEKKQDISSKKVRDNFLRDQENAKKKYTDLIKQNKEIIKNLSTQQSESTNNQEKSRLEDEKNCYRWGENGIVEENKKIKEQYCKMLEGVKNNQAEYQKIEEVKVENYGNQIIELGKSPTAHDEN